MRVVVQRCKHASVTVNEEIVGQIGKGLMVLVGVTHTDTIEDAKYLAGKVAGIRIFEDEQGKMNLGLQDIGGEVLSVSQFTLYGDCRKGKRPGFSDAARPEVATPIYEAFNEALRSLGVGVETGIFGADMDVSLTNWGPVTLIIDSPAAKN
ncbi:D-tyrosyl-tRNA(Tyr) deacylase [Paenibacillus sp. SORGH_AS306]|uniref:D-aminoacyl-tRNA deacylase n=1 Tax=unclassified Paenibacillus TaxID=185978 RepID=UPI00278516B9|nr:MULTISPECIES: D-aminoacyl-tRNA deacylase [unclassified Paenibacillus]MDQ1235333.1 D-tyrosyl-tRNA(Tyr) deacylase [Paenibacillus sp. SORGH_AS_0306]MDR6112382.1 D-tyrosyl-tRNA(Tyr) deacylase [Paenibacillus sp. SORGH_AS_0338]